MNIGFIGLGAMGELIVPRLMAAGHPVTGWNRSRAQGRAADQGGYCAGPIPRGDVAAQSGRVLTFVTDAKAVKAVALGPDGIVSGLARAASTST